MALAGLLVPAPGVPEIFRLADLRLWQAAAVGAVLAAAAARRCHRPLLAAGALALLLPAGCNAARVADRDAPLLQIADLPAGLDGPWRVVGQLAREPEPTDAGSRVVLRVERVRLPDSGPRSGPARWMPWPGTVEVSVADGSEPTGSGSGRLLPGAEVETFLALRGDRPPANPGAPSRDRLRPRGVDLRASLKSLAQLRVRSPPPPAGRLAAAIRSRLRAAIDRRFAPPHRPLVAALLLGERGRVPDATTVRMAGAGLAHVLSISGLHVGLVAMTALGAVRLAGASPRQAAAAGLVATVLLAAVVAPRPPVRRAAIMAAALLGGRVVDRRGGAGEALALAVGLLVWWWPPILGDGGFRLSVVATAGLVALVPASATRPADRLLGAAAAPLAAQAAILPILALGSGAVPLAGVLLNPLAVPLLGLLMPALLAAVLLEMAGLPGPAWAVAAIGSGGVDALLALAGSGYPRAVILLPGLGIAAMLAWWGGLGWIAWARRRRLAGVALLGVALLAAARPPAIGGARLVALDVGQGDALLVQSERAAVLVDGGGYSGIDWDIGAHVVVPALRALGVRRLAAVALTHPHRDHDGGLPAAIAAIPTERLWLGAVPTVHRPVVDLLGAAAAAGTPAIAPVRPRALTDCRWSPLVPPERILRRATRRVDNEASLVFAVACGGRQLLLTGDAGVEVEPGWPIAALRGAVLKVGHHGSRTATAASTVEALRPRIAIVSVGSRNPFGLPRDEVMDRLRDAGTALYRTDRDGALVVTLTGRRTVRAMRWASGAGGTGGRLGPGQ